MVSIDVIALAAEYQGREVNTHQNCNVDRDTHHKMPSSQVPGFMAEVGHIEGLLHILSEWQVGGSMMIEVTSDGRYHMEGEFETYFPHAKDGLYSALETIDVFCKKLKELAPQGTFRVTFNVSQTCEVTEVVS